MAERGGDGVVERECFGEGLGEDLEGGGGRRRRGANVGTEGPERNLNVAISVEVGEREDVIFVERRDRRVDDGFFQHLHFRCQFLSITKTI